jgi:hypothetical protein
MNDLFKLKFAILCSLLLASVSGATSLPQPLLPYPVSDLNSSIIEKNNQNLSYHRRQLYNGQASLEVKSILIDGVAPGTGDVSGPSSATDNAIAVFDGTDGKTLKNSTATLVSGYITAESLTGSIMNSSLETRRYQNVGIATGDPADTLVFAFVPTKIILNFKGTAVRVDPYQAGANDGMTVITITGTNTYTSILDSVCAYWNMRTTNQMSAVTRAGDEVNVIYLFTGNDPGNIQGTCIGVATWTTATKTLSITYTATNCNNASTVLLVTATAYR